MANTKVTSAVIADGAITPSKIASGDFYFDTDTLYIDSSANSVGIGTTSPVALSGQSSLTINGSVARVDLQVSQTTTGSLISESGYIHLQPASGGKALIGNGGSDLVVDSSGNVGIGTSSPSYLLDVESVSGTDNILNVRNPSTSWGEYALARFQTDTKDTRFIDIGYYRGLAESERAFIINGQSSNRLFTILESSGNVGIGTSSVDANSQLHIKKTGANAKITIECEESYDSYINFSGATSEMSLGYDATDNAFIIANAADGLTSNERMRITIDGKIGINEATPTGKLHVYDANFAGYMLNLTNGGTGGSNHGFLMECASTSAYLGIWKTQGTTRFYVDGSGTMYNDGKQGLMGVTASGDIACRSGTSTPSTKNWRWGGNIGNDVGYFINNNNQGVSMSYGSTAWSAHSDERVKENIVSLGEVLPEIQNIRCVKYNRIGDEGNTKIGFIAQDWQSTPFSEVVDDDTGFVVGEDGRVISAIESESTEYTKTIAYTETIPVLLKAIQEQQTIIDDLKARIETLENS